MGHIFNKIKCPKKAYRAKNKKRIALQVAEYKKLHYQDIQKYKKKYREENKVAIADAKKKFYEKNTEKIKKKCEEYALKHRSQIQKKKKEYREKNAVIIKKYRDEYRKNNAVYFKQYLREYVSRRRKSDPLFKLTGVIRDRLRNMLRAQSAKKILKTLDGIGCSISFLKSHLESQFREGMSWDNHGTHGWHLDHIKPVTAFDLNSPDEQKLVNHYTNLQPLWWWENLAKSNKTL